MNAKESNGYIPPSGKVVGDLEREALMKCVMELWLTEGEHVYQFERELAEYLGVRYGIMCNSGSSANLLAMTTLTDKTLDGHLKRGDEVITSALGFPTTINPILQNGLKPKFVDVDIKTMMPKGEVIQEAKSRKTKAIFMAHTLGNVLPIQEIVNTGLYFIEDNCDALGAAYTLTGNIDRAKKTGSFGIMSTQSFYPAHHITTGEGGMVVTRNSRVAKIIKSYRDWGRDCWCEPAAEGTCGKRFDWGEEFPLLPDRYDHKYIYSRIGYNLKSTDFAGALGSVQLAKFKKWMRAERQYNFSYYYSQMNALQSFFYLPEWDDRAIPSWFGYPIILRPDTDFTRDDLAQWLGMHNIGFRYLFGGNVLRQPAYQHLGDYRKFPGADYLMKNMLWIGVYPGITPSMRDYVMQVIRDFVYDIDF